MFEHRTEPVISHAAFLRRLMGHGAVAAALLGISLLLGMVGYHLFEDLSWLDAFLNAAMLLGGMGPVHVLRTPGGKLFAGLYALYAGLIFITVAGILAAPVAHRLLHRFHWKAENPEEDGSG